MKLENQYLRLPTNMFVSDIYARLYKDLMDKFSFMEDVFNKNFTKCSDVTKTLNIALPTKIMTNIVQ